MFFLVLMIVNISVVVFYRCSCVDARQAQKASRKWTLEMDVALVQYVNRLCRHLAITPARLHPHEVYLDHTDAADPRVSCLLGEQIWVESIYQYKVWTCFSLALTFSKHPLITFLHLCHRAVLNRK